MTLDSPGFLQSTSTLGGVVLARRGQYRAHGACQTTALAVTLLLTFAWMVPAFRDVYETSIKAGMRTLLALWWLTIAFGVATYLFASV